MGKGKGKAGSPFTLIATQGRKAGGTFGLHAQVTQRLARQAAAYYADAGFSCTVSATWNGPDGEREGAAHGFAFRKTTGAACPTEGCTGTIR